MKGSRRCALFLKNARHSILKAMLMVVTLCLTIKRQVLAVCWSFMSTTSSWVFIQTVIQTEKLLPNEAFMLRNKRLVWPNLNWHHWQQLQAACAVCFCMRVAVAVCLRLCVCVFASVKTRWPDCSAEQRGKIRPALCRQSSTIRKHGKRTAMHPGWQPTLLLSVCFVHVWCLPSTPPPCAHLLTVACLTMPKQAGKCWMICCWLSAAVSALSHTTNRLNPV